jgi:hypothetical protein
MSRLGLVTAATAGTLALTGAVRSRTPERGALCVGTLTPAYLEPPALEALVDEAPAPMRLIVNPANGPGPSADPAYRRVIERAQASGARVLGYVATTFGRRDSASVEADVARYREWYAVDGIFLDEVARDSVHLPHYVALRRAIGDAFVVLNPGMVPTRGYFALADIVVTYEGPFADYARRLALEPAWLRDVPPAKTAHLVYAATRDEARSLFAAPPRAGSLYVTSGSLPNPWGAPPPDLREAQAARSAPCSAP